MRNCNGNRIGGIENMLDGVFFWVGNVGWELVLGLGGIGLRIVEE